MTGQTTAGGVNEQQTILVRIHLLMLRRVILSSTVRMDALRGRPLPAFAGAGSKA